MFGKRVGMLGTQRHHLAAYRGGASPQLGLPAAGPLQIPRRCHRPLQMPAVRAESAQRQVCPRVIAGSPLRPKSLGPPDLIPNKCVPNKIKQEQKQTEAGSKKGKRELEVFSVKQQWCLYTMEDHLALERKKILPSGNRVDGPGGHYAK